MDDAARNRWLSMTVLLGFHVAFFFHAYTTPDVFFLRDVSIVQTAMKSVAGQALLQGDLPLWIPSLSGGQPLLANPNYFGFHPGNVLIALLGAVHGIKFFLLLHYLFASVGTYLLLRPLHPDPAPALFGALAFAYGGFMGALGNLTNSLAAAALLPWLLLATEAVLAGRAILLLGVVGAVQIFGGEPVPAILSFGVALFWSILRPSSTQRWRRAGRTAAGLALAALLASPQIVPALTFFSVSDRAGGLGAEQVFKWSLPPIRLLELVVPSVLGSPAWAAPPGYLGGPWEDDGYPYIISVFVGPVVLLLGAVGAAASPAARRMLGAAGVIALLGLGSHLPILPLLHGWIPFVGIFRYPAKLFLLVSFLTTVAAALGVRSLLQDQRFPRIAASGVLVALAASMAIPHLADHVAGIAAPQARDVASAPVVLSGFTTVGILLLASLLLLVQARRLMSGPQVAWSVVGLHAAHLLGTMPALLPMVPPDFYSRTPPPVQYLLDHGSSEPGRIYWEPWSGGLSLPRAPSLSPRPELPGYTGELAYGQRQLGLEFVGRVYGLEYAFETGWEGVTMKATRARVEALNESQGTAWREWLDRQNVRWVLSFESHPELRLLTRFDGLERRPVYLYENPSVQPRAPGAEVTASGNGWLRLQTRGAEDLRVAVNPYPLWRARTEDRELTVEASADGHGISVTGLDPEREQSVEIWLEPWDLRLGLVLSAVGMLLGLLEPRLLRRNRVRPTGDG